MGVFFGGQFWMCERSWPFFHFYQALCFTRRRLSDEEPLRSRGDKENRDMKEEWSFLLLRMTWEGETCNCREEKLETQRSSFQTECSNRSCPQSPPPPFLFSPFVTSPFSPSSSPYLMKDVDGQQRRSESRLPRLVQGSSSQPGAVYVFAAIWLPLCVVWRVSQVKASNLKASWIFFFSSPFTVFL